MNIIICAAGPSKEGRNRHLELYEDRIIIDRNIEFCRVDNTSLFVVVDTGNVELREHLSAIPNITTLLPEDRKIYSTYKTALSVDGGCVLVCGDLLGLESGDIQKFVESEYKSAMCHYSESWGGVTSADGTLIRRGDCDDSIFSIAQEHKEEFLSDQTYKTARAFFHKFYPNAAIVEEDAKCIGTHMTYSFFHNIWSRPEATSDGTKGLVSFKHKVWLDND